MTKAKWQTIVLDQSSTLRYCAEFMSPHHAKQLFNHCQHSFPWVQSKIQIFGRRIPIPRLNTWYGDRAYRYSGTSFEPRPWTCELRDIKKKIEEASQLSFNCALANLYRNGHDSMGWHSDDETSLGSQPQIASLSVGANRRFVLRNNHQKKDKVEFVLENGSLLLMLGNTQENWQHSLPKALGTSDPRINITFRYIEP